MQGGEIACLKVQMIQRKRQKEHQKQELLSPQTPYVMMHFHGGKNTLTIKARGRAISRAVDVVEVVRRRFFGGKLTVKDVQIGTQALGEGGDVRNVSTIEIKVAKTD